LAGTGDGMVVRLGAGVEASAPDAAVRQLNTMTLHAGFMSAFSL
jgi:hypothetical protein